MSTGTQTATETNGGAAPVSQVESDGGSMDDAFSPDERAAFEGQFGRGAPADTTEAPAKREAPAKEDPDTGASADGEEAVDGEIVFDANGNAKNSKTGQFVPKSAFLRVKGEVKEAKTQAQTLRDNLIAARERLAILTEVSQPAKATTKALEDEADIDPEVDIFGAFKQQMARVAKLQRQIAEERTQTQADRETRAMQANFKSDAERFKATTPDFEHAVQYLINQRSAELDAVGVPGEQRAQMVAEEAQALITNALKSRQSPAEVLYRMATARGYAAKKQEDRNSLANGAEQIAQMQKNQNASLSLRGAGNGASGESLSREAYANATDDEAATMRQNYIAKNGKAGWDKFLRGA